MKAPPLYVQNLKDPYFRPWGDLHTQCYERQSTMHKVGRVFLCLTVGFGAATITGALAISYCTFPYMTTTIVISVLGSTGTIFSVVFGIYLLKKDYWNDDAFRLAKRAVILDDFQNSGYGGLTKHRPHIHRYALLAQDEEKSLILKCNPTSCSGFVKMHGFGPLLNHHIDAETAFENGNTLRGLFLNEIKDLSFPAIFIKFRAENFWQLFTYQIALIEDVRAQALILFERNDFSDIIGYYGWNLFDFNIVSHKDEWVQIKFNEHLNDYYNILKFLKISYQDCKRRHLIPASHAEKLEQIKVQYDEALSQERRALQAIEDNYNQEMTRLRSRKSEQLGPIDSELLVLRMNHLRASSSTRYASHRTKHYPAFQAVESYNDSYYATTLPVLNYARISLLEGQKREIESEFISASVEAENHRRSAEAEVKADREHAEQEISADWDEFKKQISQNYTPSAPAYHV